MDATAANSQTPAQRCVRTSGVLTGLGVVAAVLLVSLPAAWRSGIEGPLLLAFFGLAGGGLVLAVTGAAVRGAHASAGTAIVLIGINLVALLAMVVTLFSFRMGAP